MCAEIWYDSFSSNKKTSCSEVEEIEKELVLLISNLFFIEKAKLYDQLIFWINSTIVIFALWGKVRMKLTNKKDLRNVNSYEKTL